MFIGHAVIDVTRPVYVVGGQRGQADAQTHGYYKNFFQLNFLPEDKFRVVPSFGQDFFGNIIMKMRNLILFVTMCIASASFAKAPDFASLQEGDIIFQETRSRQSKALKLATKSRYTHVGLIFKNKGKLYVLEAVQPVRVTGLRRFINRGVNRHFVVKRLKNSRELLTPKRIAEMKRYGKTFLGKNYDIYFGWDNKRIYCTELVWKIYKKVLNVEVGELQTLKDFDLTHAYVKKLMRERYGKRIPYGEKVISVSAMFAAENLVTVLESH